MSILACEQKGKRMNTKEEFHIYKNTKENPSNILNIMQVGMNNPIYEKILRINKDRKLTHTNK